MVFNPTYRKAISFYKTSVPGLLLVLVFSFVLLFGFFKATFPDVFYQRASGKIDTAITGIAYYQNNHTLKLKLEPGGLILYQSYPTWWYAPHPKAAELKSGKQVDVFIKRSTGTFFGIKTTDNGTKQEETAKPENDNINATNSTTESSGRIIQPAWFDILNNYFNSSSILLLLLTCLLLIAVYHYAEVIKNVYLWMPYAIGILVMAVFWGYLNLILFIAIATVVLKFIIKKRKEKQIENLALTSTSTH